MLYLMFLLGKYILEKKLLILQFKLIQIIIIVNHILKGSYFYDNRKKKKFYY